MRFPDHSDLGVIKVEGVGEFRMSMDRIGAPPAAPANLGQQITGSTALGERIVREGLAKRQPPPPPSAPALAEGAPLAVGIPNFDICPNCGCRVEHLHNPAACDRCDAMYWQGGEYERINRPAAPAEGLDVDRLALVRNVEERIDRAAMGASVGELSGSPVGEAIAWELGSLLVDITEAQGRDAAEDALFRAALDERRAGE